MALLICSSDHDSLTVFSDGTSKSFTDQSCAQEMTGLFSGELGVPEQMVTSVGPTGTASDAPDSAEQKL